MTSPFLSTTITIYVSSLLRAHPPLSVKLTGRFANPESYIQAIGQAGLSALGVEATLAIGVPLSLGHTVRLAVQLEAGFLGGSYRTSWSTNIRTVDDESCSEYLAAMIVEAADEAFTLATMGPAVRAALAADGVVRVREEPMALVAEMEKHDLAAAERQAEQAAEQALVRHLPAVSNCPFCAGGGCPFCGWKGSGLRGDFGAADAHDAQCQCPACRAARGGM